MKHPSWWFGGVLVLVMSGSVAGIYARADDEAESVEARLVEPKKVASGAVERYQSESKREEPAVKGVPKEEDFAPRAYPGAIRTCRVIVDNWTPRDVQVFVDGEFKQTVKAYGKAKGVAPRSTFELFASASYDDEEDLTWGPEEVDCSEPAFVWKLSDLPSE